MGTGFIWDIQETLQCVPFLYQRRQIGFIEQFSSEQLVVAVVAGKILRSCSACRGLSITDVFRRQGWECWHIDHTSVIVVARTQGLEARSSPGTRKAGHDASDR